MFGKIEIYGQIGECDGQKGVELIDVISQVRKQPEATGFKVHIKSEGGRVDVGFDIYNYLKALGLPIVTIGEELVASIATVIFMAGNKRIVNPNTEFMIHLPMGGIDFATAAEMEDYTKQMKQAETEIVGFYTKELGISKEAVFPLLRNETWLSNEQLLSLGFVTSTSPMQIAAKFKKSTNKKNNKMSKKSKLATLLAKLIGDEVVNKVIFSADEKEIVFPDIAEDGVIEVGASATYDGQPAEGEIVGQDGKVYVFESGVLMEIKDPITNQVEDEEVAEALVEILEILEDIYDEVEEVKKEVNEVKEENVSLKARLMKASSTITALKGKSETPKDDDKKEKKKDEGVSSLVAQWRANKKQVKNN